MGLLSHLLHRFVRNGHLLVTDYAGRTVQLRYRWQRTKSGHPPN